MNGVSVKAINELQEHKESKTDTSIWKHIHDEINDVNKANSSNNLKNPPTPLILKIDSSKTDDLSRSPAARPGIKKMVAHFELYVDVISGAINIACNNFVLYSFSF
mgnify:CR=1 FL=1